LRKSFFYQIYPLDAGHGERFNPWRNFFTIFFSFFEIRMESALSPGWKAQTLSGEPAPPIESFRGRPLLVLFFSRGCPACLSRAVPYARALAYEFPELAIVGIHTRLEGPVYSPDQVNEIVQLHRIAYPVLLDDGHESYDRMGAEGTPHWILIDATGRLVRSLFGSMPNTIQRLQYVLLEMGLGSPA
jgi:thiol-disulfide isomerase/thioredoxin